jgi:hypothetical protein
MDINEHERLLMWKAVISAYFFANKIVSQLDLNPFFISVAQMLCQFLHFYTNLVRKDMDVNEHERLSNLTLIH